MGKSSRERPGPTPGVETRRANLRTLMEQRGVNALARQLGLQPRSSGWWVVYLKKRG